MPQATTGLRAVLNLPQAYNSLMAFLGEGRLRQAFVDQHLQPRPMERILDVGCGTGTILEFLPTEVDYTGVDLSADYIAYANQRFGNRARFLTGDVNTLSLDEEDRFDVITALGLLHHLSDEEVAKLAGTAHALLRDSGRFITVDNCFTGDQNIVAKTLIRCDRGRNTRTPAGYISLLRRYFEDITSEVRHDMLRIPYTHVIIEATVR